MATRRGERRRRTVLASFAALHARLGRPPSVRELAVALGIQISATHRHLELLRKAGFLEFRSGGFRLRGSASVAVPVHAGRVGGAPDGWIAWPAAPRAERLVAIRTPDEVVVLDGRRVAGRVSARKSSSRL